VIPEKLSRVVDKFVKVDLNDPGSGSRDRLMEAINEFGKTLDKKLGDDG